MKLSDDNPEYPIWGAAAIGQVIGRSERQTFHMLEAGLLPAKKLGQRWVASKRKLLAVVSGDKATRA